MEFLDKNGKELFVINGIRIWAESKEQAKELYKIIEKF
jgi:hypothetical protein